MPDHSSVDGVGDGFSASTRHVVDGAGTIELKTETPNAGLYFTLDGSNPTNGSGSTRELIGAPWVAQHDSIRVYAGPIQISQNVEIRAVARRNGYNYVSGNWGSDVTILQNSPIVSANYKAVYDYDQHLLANGGFEKGDLSGWD